MGRQPRDIAAAGSRGALRNTPATIASRPPRTYGGRKSSPVYSRLSLPTYINISFLSIGDKALVNGREHHTHAPCVLAAPPETRFLDRLARFFEGGDRGEPTDVLVDLGAVVADAPDNVAAFYRDPARYVIFTGATAGRWSRFVMKVFAATFRQSRIPERAQGFQALPVCQRIYRDARGRTHWDRYACVDGTLERLFVARLDGARGRMNETFVLWGVPIRLGFEAQMDGETLVLTLRRRYSSVLAWPARVQYRTTAHGRGLTTDGDFRVPIALLHVKMRFLIETSQDPGA
jgi:hypothetical protein